LKNLPGLFHEITIHILTGVSDDVWISEQLPGNLVMYDGPLEKSDQFRVVAIFVTSF